MQIQQTVSQKTTQLIKHSASVKIVTIAILVLVLLIPMIMIKSLIRERENRRNSVVSEISEKWGGNQTITGPFITIPYKVIHKDEKDKDKETFSLHSLHILPDQLNITGKINPEVRSRSLYEAVLYNMTITVNGDFKLPPVEQFNIDEKNILFDKAFFSIGISDMRGIQEKITVTVNKSDYECNPGLKSVDIAPSGVGALIQPLSFEKENSFSFSLNLNGSEQINFIPVAKTNTVQIQSKWPSPSFNGAFLPASRDVTKDGFSAHWKVLHLNRNYPQFWNGDQYKVEPSAFGLKLVLTADVYQKATRISKYAIIFIVFTFSAFFFSEILNKYRVHPVQYLLIGLAILLFYTLLLSLSEYINFNTAYIVSALSVIAVITGYSRGIIKHVRFTYTIMGILVILYSYLFIILQLEDYALIMGSVGLFIVLTLVMYITRKIDWYAIES